MKAKQIPITSGPASGTLVTRVESNSGKLLGFIRVVNVDWTSVLGATVLYIAQQCYCTNELKNSRFKTKACGTLLDAYKFLGISLNEIDHSDTGKWSRDEHIPSDYWKREQKEPNALEQLRKHLEDSHL